MQFPTSHVGHHPGTVPDAVIRRANKGSKSEPGKGLEIDTRMLVKADFQRTQKAKGNSRHVRLDSGKHDVRGGDNERARARAYCRRQSALTEAWAICLRVIRGMEHGHRVLVAQCRQTRLKVATLLATCWRREKISTISSLDRSPFRTNRANRRHR